MSDRQESSTINVATLIVVLAVLVLVAAFGIADDKVEQRLEGRLDVLERVCR